MNQGVITRSEAAPRMRWLVWGPVALLVGVVLVVGLWFAARGSMDARLAARDARLE